MCTLLIAIAVPLFASSATADQLKIPTAIFATAAGADLAATYYTSTRMGLSERNPLINWLQEEPAVMVAVAGAATTIGTYAWLRYVGRKHPKIAAAGLYVAAGIEVFYAARNMKRGFENVR